MPEREGMLPATAIVFALVGYFALLVCGLGVTSLVTDRNVLVAPGAGVIPGVVGATVSVAAVALVLALLLRVPRPSYGGAALLTALMAFLGYVVGLVIGVVIAGVDAGILAALTGSFVLSWFAVVVAAVGAVTGWVAVALVRTRAERPRWPWENDEDE
ncbi:hypothetical protein [Microbacterium jiangjiandongii]|uniref:hypothetical protein n=1 Tax=Microbacterium jiangjiandongii TaxID=3049071 RepID=UPI00214B36CF|nr:hypothetical protein [Microbacterium sp. zg.Y843]MCR2816778.1 hypothetical protein [Microbacterium sp. zg.Y843]